MADTSQQSAAEKAKAIAEKVEGVEVASDVEKFAEGQKPLAQSGISIPTQEKELALDQAKDLVKAVDAFILGNSLLQKLQPEQVELCKRTAVLFGLNPLKREIHFVPRWNDKAKAYDVTTVIGYEVYIARAEATGLLDGWGVTFDGQGPSMKAILTVYRKGWERPFVHEVYLQEAQQDTPVWRKMPRFMLRKTVIGQGFRLCFPQQMGGLPYMPEELGIGVIENGQLTEEQAGKAAAPAKITPKDIDFIETLLDRKGLKKEPIYKFYGVKSISDLTALQAAKAIKRLQTYPDLQPDTVDVDPDEAERGIQQMRQEEAQQ